MDRIDVVKGDITQQQVDAIVNAANNSLLGGGGVVGAIHRAAGSGLLRECKTLGGCATGDAKITGGYDLPARWVIHTVGPVWYGGYNGEGESLASWYRRCLELAAEHSIRTLAFPAISTGAYGFPVDEATNIAVTEVVRFMESNSTIDRVVFVCFNEQAADAHKSTMAELPSDGESVRNG